MALLDPNRKYSEVSKSQGTQISPNSKAPRAQTSPAFPQLIQGEASLWSPNSSPKLRKNYEHEEDHHNRKSVLMKVKERAKKLRNSLSGKKHQDHHLDTGNSTPSWGVRLEDYEDEEEDPEYLGAPMYESELAPETYKETARQHPREVHVVPSEKHVITSSVKQGKEEHPSPNKTITESTAKQGKEEHPSPNKTITETVSEKLGPTYTAVSERVSEKLAPAYAAASDATQNVANKIANLTVSTPEGTDSINDGRELTRSPQTWDKGVSVKEYLMQKLEPGEDERALSQVISETISPRRTPGDAGMVEKMKGAVSSFLWTEESSQATTQSTNSADIQNSSNASPSSPKLVSTTKTSSSSHASVSPTNAPTAKTSPLSHTSLSPTNAFTTKTSSLSHTSLSPTNASTTKTSSLPHTPSTTNAARPATSKRRLSTHAPASTTIVSTAKTSSSAHTPVSTTNAKSSTQIPISTYVSEVIEEENCGRVLQAN